MPSTAQATFFTSTIQSIIDALADYTKVTGIDLSKIPFATATEHLTSPEAILELLQAREKEFKEYRDGNRGRLIGCLRPAVTVIQAFSGVPGKAARLVSHTYHPCNSLMTCQVPFPPANALFAGIDALLAVRPSNTHYTLLNRPPLINEYARPLVGLPPVMMLFSSCSSVWGISSSVWRFIRRFRPLRC
jgi:fungal STAND N-terminal Goodbye domain